MEMFVSVDMAETTVTQENSQQEVNLAVPIEGTEATGVLTYYSEFLDPTF